MSSNADHKALNRDTFGRELVVQTHRGLSQDIGIPLEQYPPVMQPPKYHISH